VIRVEQTVFDTSDQGAIQNLLAEASFNRRWLNLIPVLGNATPISEVNQPHHACQCHESLCALVASRTFNNRTPVSVVKR
jgi:hypothetical protein